MTTYFHDINYDQLFGSREAFSYPDSTPLAYL